MQNIAEATPNRNLYSVNDRRSRQCVALVSGDGATAGGNLPAGLRDARPIGMRAVEALAA